MGERFGYYTMLSIFVLYLQDHFAWSAGRTGSIFGILLFGTYGSAIIGGLIADKFLGYSKTVLIGLLVMASGYFILAKPVGMDPTFVYIAMITIMLGVGLFKGNIAVITGNLYEDKKISHLRDSAFNLFYMGINIGAFFSPFTANALKTLVLKKSGYVYNASIPKIAHEVLAGNNENIQILREFAGAGVTNLTEFAANYIRALSNGYNLAFGAAGLTMLASLLVFVLFKKHYKHADYLQKDKIKAGEAIDIPKKEVTDRIVALIIVFIAAIAFFTALNLGAGPMTFFARSYTRLSVSKFTYLLFTAPTLFSVCILIIGFSLFLRRKNSMKLRIAGIVLAAVSVIFIYYKLNVFPDINRIDPELFQTFNPVYIVFLTPVVIGFFAFLNKRNKEPSSPRKMIYGLFVTGVAFGVLLIASIGLPKMDTLVGNVVDPSLAVTPYFLITFYLGLTIGELFFSPIGLSFVAKVAPPKLRGSMQAGWLLAIGLGGLLAGSSSVLFENFDMWQYFVLLIGFMIVAAILILIFLKKIHAATSAEL
jgi:POT family proton-dependent oligopeptide transporter